MPPKAKPGAKGKAAGKAAAKPAAAPATPPPEVAPALSVPEAEVGVEEVPEEAWAELAECEEPAPSVARALEALLLLLGDPAPGAWPSAQAALADRAALLREVRALGPWGATEAAVAQAAEALAAADLAALRKPPAAGSGAAAAAALRGAPKAKAKPAPKAKAAAPPLPRGAAAALALGLLVEALIATRREERPPGIPSWPTDPLARLHERLQAAMFGRQQACVVAPGRAAAAAAALCMDLAGAVVCDVGDLQAQVGLRKTLRAEAAAAQVAECWRRALAGGRRLALLLGSCVPDLRTLSGAAAEAFDFEQGQAVAEALGLPPPPLGFHVVVVAEMPRARAERLLPGLVPSFEEMAVLVVDEGSLPPPAALEGFEATAPSLRAALRLLALPPAAAPAQAPAVEGAAPAPTAAAPAAAPMDVDGAMVNTEDFEFVEAFGEDWEQRWSAGPWAKDEHGKDIRAGLVKATLAKYPPRDAKPCMQLVGGAVNSPCTGIWTSFSPIARPTEVEFEFTMNGKVDLPNACVVFTQTEFKGALPDCKIGVQFSVRSGMQLSGGGGNLIRISNDGKIQNDKWNKVLLKIDWGEKIVVGQVDTRGKGYAPAIQTVPFRDSACEGFGFLYIYNTDMHGTCWFHSLRVKQDASAVMAGTEGLEARAFLAKRLKEREYQKAVDADMAVGMKMGAIKSTKQHGMNLAEEQRANNYVR